MQGNFAASEAELDTALRLNPGDAGLLASLSTWAVTFGHPERGAEAADHAIRLNPTYRVDDAWGFLYAYFHAVDSRMRCASWIGSRKTSTS